MLLKLGRGVRVVATHLTLQYHTRVSWTETGGKGQLGKAWTWGVDLTTRSRLANHVAGDQMTVEDVPRGGDKATAMTHPVQCVCVDFKVALTVCFRGEG